MILAYFGINKIFKITLWFTKDKLLLVDITSVMYDIYSIDRGGE